MSFKLVSFFTYISLTSLINHFFQCTLNSHNRTVYRIVSYRVYTVVIYFRWTFWHKFSVFSRPY